MRRILWLLFLVPLAAGEALPEGAEVSFDPPPAVGVASRLRVAFDAPEALDARLRLHAPPWIDVDGPEAQPARAGPGERVELAWTITATRAGFWHAIVDGEGTGALPAVYAWSTHGRGLGGADPDAGVPGESTVGFHPSLRARGADEAELVLRVSPQDARYAGQDLLFEMPAKSGRYETAPADTPHEFVHAFALADGARAVLTPAAHVRIRFDAAEGRDAPTHIQHVACANIEVAREGDEVREVDRWGCAAERPNSSPSRLDVAAPALGALLGLALAARRRR